MIDFTARAVSMSCCISPMNMVSSGCSVIFFEDAVDQLAFVVDADVGDGRGKFQNPAGRRLHGKMLFMDGA